MSTRLRSPAADLPPDDLLLEAFLRLPPEPCHLYAVSRVCRRWRRLVRCPAFLSSFRAFHRAPPVLGIFENTGSCVRFVPTTAPRARRIRPGWNVLDCRHSRVLLINYANEELIVWDPMEGEADYVSLSDGLMNEEVAGAVVCAAGHDVHIDCHSCPFKVIFFEWEEDDAENDACWGTCCVYSSETGGWGEWTETTFPAAVSSEASAFVGDSVYWKLESAEDGSHNILEFNLPREEWETIELPDEFSELYSSNFHIMPVEGGGLGFAGVNESSSSIHLWSRMIDSEGLVEWAMTREINMHNLTLSGVPAGDMLSCSSVVAYAEDSDVLFLESEAGIFMINLLSVQLRKVPQQSSFEIYPYSSFYTRGRDIPGIDVKDVMYGIKYQRKKRAASQLEAMD